MRVSALQISFLNSYKPKRSALNRKADSSFMTKPEFITPSSPITFGIANCGKLKALFSHGMPCMYSGIEMIDPKRVQKMLKNHLFDGAVSNVVPLLTKFEDNIDGIEKRVFTLIKEKAEIYPAKNLKEILETLVPTYNKRIKKKQMPIFEDLIEMSHELPESHRYKFRQFMAETYDKVNNKPIIVPFSTFEFKYKLGKIKEDIDQKGNIKASKVIKIILKESKKLSADTNFRTIDNQKAVLKILNTILNNTVLRENEPLRNLINTSIDRLNGMRALIPFSRKSFIYDLSKIIKGAPGNLQEAMLLKAQELPTSRDSLSAYILKFSKEPPEKIAYRLLWPTFASVEHILPQSCGGPDAMSNFGGACTRENSDRKSLDFFYQLKRKPEAKINCQKYVDRLIEFAKNGIFAKYNLDTKYITDFKNTIQKQSRGALVLDISKLFEK